MTWETHNISRTNDFASQGIIAGAVGARGMQQHQWKNVMSRVYQYMGKPKIEVAQSVIKDYHYDDWNNSIGAQKGKTEVKDGRKA